MSFNFAEFDPRSVAVVGAYGLAVGAAGVGITCMGTVAGSGNPLIKRTTDDWATAPTTVMTTPNANGYLCQQGFDVGGDVVLVNRRDNTGGTGRTLNVHRSINGGATWALAQALLTYNIGSDEAKRMSPFARLGTGAILINAGYNDIIGASVAVSEVFSSSDGGATWAGISDLVSEGVFDPTNPLTADGDAFLDMIVLDDGTTVVGTFLNQIWSSTNGGVSWALRATLDAAITSATLCDLHDGTVLALGVTTPAADVLVYRSDDASITWAQVATISTAGWTSNSRGRQNIARYAAGSAFAIIDDRSNASIPTVYYTEDAGDTWTKAYVASGTVSGHALILPSDGHAAFFANGTFWYDVEEPVPPPPPTPGTFNLSAPINQAIGPRVSLGVVGTFRP